MRYLSLFSGIEAASVAWHPLGWECVGVAEMDRFSSTVLAHHYPHVPNLGDVTKVTEADILALGQIDLVVFGSPCQDLSVAGKRKGLAGARSGLFFTALNIVHWARTWGGCRFALWENVPGAFSSNKGADFAAVVDALAGLDGTAVPPKGWGTEGCAVGNEAMVEWATLDAQWFGVAQKRRRVFALADFGDWARRPPILLEPQGLRGDSAPRRGPGENVAGTLAASAGSSDPSGSEQRPVLVGAVGKTLTAGGHSNNPLDENLVVYDTTQITSRTNRSNPQPGGPCHALAAGAHPPLLSFNAIAFLHVNNGRPAGRQSAHEPMVSVKDHVPTLATDCHSASALVSGMQVRRLTPTECERLQAVPDGYTQVPVRGKPAADGPRYKALGNSMCVTVMRWIGERIDFVQEWH